MGLMASLRSKVEQWVGMGGAFWFVGKDMCGIWLESVKLIVEMLSLFHLTFSDGCAMLRTTLGFRFPGLRRQFVHLGLRGRWRIQYVL